MLIHNRTRGPVRLLGKSLPRSNSLELDEKLLTENELTELRAAEAFKSIHCTPSLLTRPTPPAPLPQQKVVLQTKVQPPEKAGTNGQRREARGSVLGRGGARTGDPGRSNSR